MELFCLPSISWYHLRMVMFWEWARSSAEQQCWNWPSPSFTCWGFGFWNRSSAIPWGNGCTWQWSCCLSCCFQGYCWGKGHWTKSEVLVHGALPFEMDISCIASAVLAELALATSCCHSSRYCQRAGRFGSIWSHMLEMCLCTYNGQVRENLESYTCGWQFKGSKYLFLINFQREIFITT